MYKNIFLIIITLNLVACTGAPVNSTDQGSSLVNSSSLMNSSSSLITTSPVVSSQSSVRVSSSLASSSVSSSSVASSSLVSAPTVSSRASSVMQSSSQASSVDGMTGPLEIKVTRDITYATWGNVRVKLDLHQPKGNMIYPGVILVHGGGWVGGTKTGYHSTAFDLAKKGYVVANIDYRLASQNKKAFPEAVQDVKAAIRWLRFNISKKRRSVPRKYG